LQWLQFLYAITVSIIESDYVGYYNSMILNNQGGKQANAVSGAVGGLFVARLRTF
jgi:hypothetical protein